MKGIIYRDYQHKYINNIKLSKSNLCISTMGSGKTLILKGIIDKYFTNKKVLIITNRRGLTEQLSKTFEDHTFILSGKEHDESKNIHLATTQTFQRRNYNLKDYDLIAVDEIHETYNIKLIKQIRELECTRVYLTGTPIDSKGKFLGEFDNVLEFTNMKEMIEQRYLAQTKFISKANILSDEKSIDKRNGEYIEADVERVIDKQAIIQWLIKDNIKYEWSTKHKCIMYVNSIKTALKIEEAFNDSVNVKTIHSKLSKKQVEKIDNWFHDTAHGILVNCRMYTTGTDIPSADTIINVTPTAITSLYLQSIWRASRIYGNKIATVYDYTGNLYKISPYFNDWYNKPKPTCKQKCEEFPPNTMDRYICLQTCKPSPDSFIMCDGNPSLTFINDDYKMDFQVYGTPCKEGAPFYQWEYKTTIPKDSIGTIHKWSKCPNCGTRTRYTIHTMTEPSEAIELYSEEVYVDQNEIMFIYNKQLKKGLMVISDTKLKNYKYEIATSPEELYTKALKMFKNRKFSISSNVPISVLPNVHRDSFIEKLVNIVDWDKDNPKVMRKVIKSIVEAKVEQEEMKRGYTYFFMKNVETSNERYVFKQLQKVNDRYDLIKLSKKLEK